MRPDEMAFLFDGSGLEISEVHHLGVLPFFDSFMPFPPTWVRGIERGAIRHSALKGLAQNWIYVCRKVNPN